MASSSGVRHRRARKLATLVSVVACSVPFAAQPAQSQALVLDQGGTVALPTINAGDIEILGPSTVRVRGIVNTRNLDTTVHLRYGVLSVLDRRTANLDLEASLQPTAVVEDLLDLEPGESYNVQLVAETPAGTFASNTVPFTLPAAVYVDPATGATVSSTAVKRGSKKASRCTIVGTNKRDKLVGTKQRDVICGLGGNDRILGRGGNDVILAGKGNDKASGGAGHDQLSGNSGRDRLNGNAGNDKIRGHSGRDRLNGNAGRDRLYDNGGGKVTAARRNRDVIHGGSGRDRASVNKGDRVRSVERVSRRR